MMIRDAKNCVATLACAVIAAVTVTLRADLILYEGFNYSGLADQDSLVGSGASELGFDSADKWAKATGTLRYIEEGLRFGVGGFNLATAGGYAQFTGNGNSGRRFSADATGTLWGSFLWRADSSLTTASSSGMTFANALDSTYGNSQFSVIPDGNITANRARISLGGGYNSPDDATSIAVVRDVVYLCLFKVTNVNGSPADSTLTFWLLNPEQFAYHKAANLLT